MRYKTPYYLKNNTASPSKIETINEKDIRKYLRLIYDVPQAHRPNELCIFLVDIDEKTGKVIKTNLANEFDKEFVDLVNAKLLPKVFFNQIKNYKHYYELEKK